MKRVEQKEEQVEAPSGEGPSDVMKKRMNLDQLTTFYS